MLAGKLRAGHARPLQSGIFNGYLFLARAVVALTTPVAVTLKPDGVLRQLGVKALGDLHHQGALHPLAEHLAAVLISAVDVAGGVQSVGRAAASAVQARRAVLVTPSQTLPSLYAGSPTNWWQGYRSPQGVTAMYSVPEPQPEMRL